ncbi:shikimate kinase [Mucilaginibacter yixingensis]|uniref:Shikimate kinase n=1 Tax=Mucilaginibacter yixingensis TaxID=1295612 RepID=A0A2T5JC10_9SPHI|nr:AAA family ATPase [Mucilaginibacter yixingensis]PTQ99288.1 shikimate kinase [Mucilaginibacter yixingensis]
MRIHIVGAAGVGKTTLGIALAAQMDIPYFDSDAYFWADSDEPFTVKRPPELRNAMLLADLERHESYIVGGSMISWEIDWNKWFDLIVFLRLSQEIRMQRLHNRELERYGESIYTERAPHYKEFMDWARGYEDDTTPRRSLRNHQEWLQTMRCPILEIADDTTTDERIDRILQTIHNQ